MDPNKNGTKRELDPNEEEIKKKKQKLREIKFAFGHVPDLLGPLSEDQPFLGESSRSNQPLPIQSAVAEQSPQSVEAKTADKGKAVVPDIDPEMISYFRDMRTDLENERTDLSRFQKSRIYAATMFEKNRRNPEVELRGKGCFQSFTQRGRYYPRTTAPTDAEHRYLYPQRKRTLDQIRRHSLASLRKQKSDQLLPSRRRMASLPKRPKSTELKNRSIKALIDKRKRNLEFERRQEQRLQKHRQWRDMEDRKGWKRSQYNIQRINAEKAGEIMGKKYKTMFSGVKRKVSSPFVRPVARPSGLVRGIDPGLPDIPDEDSSDSSSDDSSDYSSDGSSGGSSGYDSSSSSSGPASPPAPTDLDLAQLMARFEQELHDLDASLEGILSGPSVAPLPSVGQVLSSAPTQSGLGVSPIPARPLVPYSSSSSSSELDSDSEDNSDLDSETEWEMN